MGSNWRRLAHGGQGRGGEAGSEGKFCELALSSILILPGHHEMNRFTLQGSSVLVFCFARVPKAMVPTNLGLKPSAQTDLPSSLEADLHKYFVTAMED